MNILEMRGITKAFSGVTVLKDVDLTVEAGSIHALLGENGAGKSTLMNILTGVLARDSGTIAFNGSALTDVSVKKTEALGIAFVHQELNLFNDLRVYENMFLGKERTGRLGSLKKREMIDMTHELFQSLGVEIDPMVPVSSLETSSKQLLEISKALFVGAKLLILDEPTTALNNEEIEHLFGILRSLNREGKSFIFISHKMPEIFSIADSYTILRNGSFVETGKIADTTPDELAGLMVGSAYSAKDVYERRELGEPVLTLAGFCGPGFADVDLTVRKGEILGLTGLRGAGSSELMQAVFGAIHPFSGTMTAFGKEVRMGHIHSAMKERIAMLPANRKENSLLTDMSILENTYISEHTLSGRRQHISKKREGQKYESLKALLTIKANDKNDRVMSLSGGNQQKVFLARWLNTDAELLLLDNPTQGIDVGAKAEIYKLILSLAKSGKTILINTLEIPELQKVADRCAVFYGGRIIKLLSHDELDEKTVMLYSTNAINAAEVKSDDR